MPKSKREKKVSLTKTKKKGRSQKESLISTIRSSVSSYPRLFLLSFQNPRNTALKSLRDRFTLSSRFFLGKNKVMAAALGRTKEEEIEEGIGEVAKRINGGCGLMFSNEERKMVEGYFEGFSEASYARAGFVSPVAFSLPAGPLPTDVAPHPIEPQLRKLGLPTRLKDGVIELLSEVAVCKKGDVLTPEQCKILQLFDQKIAEMKVEILGVYENGEYEVVKEREEVVKVLNLDDEDDDEEDDGMGEIDVDAQFK